MELELLNFGAPKQGEVEFKQATVNEETLKGFTYLPLPQSTLVLKPSVSQTTKGGIQKSDAQIADELKKMDYPMTVLKASKDVEQLGIKSNTKVVVNRFTATNLPSPVEGFDVVLVRLHEILAYDSASLTV